MSEKVAKLVAYRYMQSNLFTDIEDLEGLPTYRDDIGPGEEHEEAQVTKVPPPSETEWTGGNPSYMRPDIPEDVRK